MGIVKMVTHHSPPKSTILGHAVRTTAGPMHILCIYSATLKPLQRGLYYTHTSISIIMERTIQYYLIETHNYDHINRMWDWCQFQGRDIPMYKTRISKGSTAWVVECPTDRVQTAFLLNFAHWVCPISAPRIYT